MMSFSATYLRHTDAAVLVEYEGSEIWLPLSQCVVEDLDTCARGEDIDIEIPAWLAKAKDME